MTNEDGLKGWIMIGITTLITMYSFYIGYYTIIPIIIFSGLAAYLVGKMNNGV